MASVSTQTAKLLDALVQGLCRLLVVLELDCWSVIDRPHDDCYCVVFLVADEEGVAWVVP